MVRSEPQPRIDFLNKYFFHLRTGEIQVALYRDKPSTALFHPEVNEDENTVVVFKTPLPGWKEIVTSSR